MTEVQVTTLPAGTGERATITTAPAAVTLVATPAASPSSVPMVTATATELGNQAEFQAGRWIRAG